ncbi:C39 family peptidase [Paenibacillus chartarius]|uniref:C39 family peptidase n=1 Tax=Paenibacillus chartarius TaxID=747481 RepID=A0ABV6DKJ3_9BACL
MLILWQGIKVTIGFLTVVVLTLSSGLFTVLLYDKYIGNESASIAEAAPAVTVDLGAAPQSAVPAAAPVAAETKAASAMLEAPAIKQYPELPTGCEVTSLTMLLQYAGISKNKLELAAELPKDGTAMQTDSKGNIVYWGNPNVGFVGDVTGKTGRGFGIYHAGLFPLLKKYLPGAVDLTGKSFDALEQQVAAGYPVVVWNTVDYNQPTRWMIWDTAIGPIRTTFAEHAVLLVGYDAENVYVNDPISGAKAQRINKAQFIEVWKTMGKQALSYTNT